MRRKFRDFSIKRSCNKNYTNYTRYKPYLKQDFSCRCAYCNLLDTSITTPFEVDHFIPRDTFKDDWPECDTLYENLIYSCKKCNIAKSSQFSGDISPKKIINEFFYNPVLEDYGEIFYRNDYGGIDSDDLKGREMIKRLKLYRPIHNIAWLCEALKNLLVKINNQIEKVGRDSEQGKVFLLAKEELSDYYITCQHIFIENYNNEKFVMPE
ncbi:HNH endonuclease signature motif containing protein [Clostridium sp. BNL1100]|uniref:HNH endonuclease n=1 Tax=Clostridium sp. BNL1100 TaxID=755731 RepID=UPI00024A76C9|nr:HNH endonuclease signature motif containing protein [Clostridium sp. BNL1100]AEY65604.1 HNH endonuclease [Clostridium sp. BNL1100]